MELPDRFDESLVAFDRERAADYLMAALDRIGAACAEDVPRRGRLGARRTALARWVRFFAALDRSIDPRWDERRVPMMRVEPPRSGGVQLPTGADPALISDPAARAEYERAIRANHEYADYFGLQLDLHRLEQRANVRVRQFFAEHYTTAQGDRDEVVSAVAAAPLSEARRAQLRAAFPTP